MNVTLLGSQLLCSRALWADDLDLAACRQIFSVFYTAATEVTSEESTLGTGIKHGLSVEDWVKATVQGADEKSPRWRHVLLIGSILLGIEGQNRRVLSTLMRHRLESALVRATNLALHENVSKNGVEVYSIIFVLNHTFHLLSDFERAQIQYNDLLPALLNATFFSKEGLQNAYFVGAIDRDILEVPDQKFGWHPDTPSFRLIDQILSRPLLFPFGPLSRLIAHAVKNVDNPSLVLATLEDLLTFSKVIQVQWRQNKLSEIDKSEEVRFLDEQTITQTLPKLWQILQMTLFAHVIILRAVIGRLLGDPVLSSNTSLFSSAVFRSHALTILDASKVSATTLHIFRNLYFISSRLGETSSSQYCFVNLTAIDVIAQYQANTQAFLQAIRPPNVGQIPLHPLDRCLDLFYLNTAEHFTVALAPNLNDELLITVASPYLTAENNFDLHELFEAAHSAILAVFATPQCAELAARHLPFYIDALFSAFPHTLSARQFRLAFKTVIRITSIPSSISINDPLLPTVLLDMVHERALNASVDPLPQAEDGTSSLGNTKTTSLSEQAILILSLIDSLCYLSIPLLQDWLPITADIVQRIPNQDMKYVCQERFWEAMNSGDMDVERAVLCVAWWTTQGGRERTLFGDEPSTDTKYMMSGGLGFDSKL